MMFIAILLISSQTVYVHAFPGGGGNHGGGNHGPGGGSNHGPGSESNHGGNTVDGPGPMKGILMI